MKQMHPFAALRVAQVKGLQRMVLKLQVAQAAVLISDQGGFKQKDYEKWNTFCICPLQRCMILCADVALDPDNIDGLLRQKIAFLQRFQNAKKEGKSPLTSESQLRASSTPV